MTSLGNGIHEPLKRSAEFIGIVFEYEQMEDCVP
jgi:hypothetical protein